MLRDIRGPKSLLLQHSRTISWCSLKIIHPGLGVFLMVEFLVFSAHIMKWECCPAMRPACSQRLTWRTCCWGNNEKRKRESPKEWDTTFCESMEKRIENQMSSRKTQQKCNQGMRRTWFGLSKVQGWIEYMEQIMYLWQATVSSVLNIYNIPAPQIN